MKVRKSNVEGVQTRAAILDATESIMREEGYAAVSSRRVAERAGLKSQLVYYHFGTMDELFLAVYQRSEAQYFEAHAKALAAKNPLRALWDLSLNPRGAALEIELLALANHRKSISKEIAKSTHRFRSLQTAAITRVLDELGIGDERVPAEVLALALITISRGLVAETSLGISIGHEAMLAFVEKKLKALEEGGAAARRERVHSAAD